MHYLYCISESDAGPCKIGITSNLQSRLRSFQTANYRRLELAWSMAFATKAGAYEMEQAMLLDDRRMVGEWINRAPSIIWEQLDIPYFLRWVRQSRGLPA